MHGMSPFFLSLLAQRFSEYRRLLERVYFGSSIFVWDRTNHERLNDIKKDKKIWLIQQIYSLLGKIEHFN